MTHNTHRTPMYLILMLVAIASAPLDIYNIHKRQVGIAQITPWRRTLSVTSKSLGARVAAFLRGIWTGHRQLVVATACLLALLATAHLHAHTDATLGAGAAVAVAGQLNVAQLERDLLKTSGEATSLLEKTMRECQAYEEKDKEGKVTVQGRLMTEDESKAVKALIEKGNGIRAQIERAKGDSSMADAIAKMTAGMTAGDPSNSAVRAAIRKSIGEQWTESASYKAAQAHAAKRSTGWTAPMSEEMYATTLDETSGSGGQLIVTEYRPGILPLLFKRLTIADLLGKGSTDSNSVTYMRETTFTNAAAPVAEGAPKPESTLIFDQVTDMVRKIAHWLPVTDEMLEDVSQIRSYIDARLKLGLDITKEDQLLNGSGTAPAIQGLLNRSGLTTATTRTGSVTNAEAIFTAQMAVFNASFVMPSGTVMNPLNWQTTQLSKDGEGRYYGSGPFAGPQVPTLWGLPVVVTPSIVANTALTGAFDSAAQVFDKGGVRIEASNSHQDFFIRNLTAIRAEIRLALAVYRPAAFTKVLSLT